jgi:hypothetical protein
MWHVFSLVTSALASFLQGLAAQGPAPSFVNIVVSCFFQEPNWRRAQVLISDYICNWRREVGDTPGARLPFGFGRVSIVSFLCSEPGELMNHLMLCSKSCLVYLFLSFASCLFISKCWMSQKIEKPEARQYVLLVPCDFWISQNPTRKSDEKMKQIRMIQNPDIDRDAR